MLSSVHCRSVPGMMDKEEFPKGQSQWTTRTVWGVSKRAEPGFPQGAHSSVSEGSLQLLPSKISALLETSFSVSFISFSFSSRNFYYSCPGSIVYHVFVGTWGLWEVAGKLSIVSQSQNQMMLPQDSGKEFHIT